MAANPHFIYAILRQHKRFEALRDFTLEQGQEEIDRENRLKKDRGEGVESSPKASFSMSEMQRPKKGGGSEPPSSPDAFEIGEDSDDEEEEGGREEPKPAKTNESVPTSPRSPMVASPTAMSETASTSGQAEDAVPLQLRGMSEKARGKLPEGAFQRQGSTTSLANHISSVAALPTSGSGFVPTPAWVYSPHLPENGLESYCYIDRELASSPSPAYYPHSDPTAPTRASFHPRSQTRRQRPPKHACTPPRAHPQNRAPWNRANSRQDAHVRMEPTRPWMVRVPSMGLHLRRRAARIKG